MKIFICFTILLLNCSLAFAHSCPTYKNLPDDDYNEKLRSVDAIFDGEIVSVTHLSHQTYLIKLKLLRVWKGEKPTEITVKYGNPCGNQAPSVGGKWIMYAYKQENETLLSVDCCKPFDDARMKLVYGEGEAVEPPEDSSQTAKQDAPAESYWSWFWNKIGSFFS